MKIRIAVLFGGRSVEHEISIISGIQALQNMDTDKYDITPVYIAKNGFMYTGDGAADIGAYKNIPALLNKLSRVIFVGTKDGVVLRNYPETLFNKLNIPVDLVLPVVHGTNVEDGALQGYLKSIGVPFAGCDVCASALGMDKYFMKTILKDAGINVLPGMIFTTKDYRDVDGIISRIEQNIGYPVIIKPANLGSSVGISIAKDKTGLIRSLDEAFTYSRRVLAEHAIEHLREINCAVLGDADSAIASECEEPSHSDEILSYKDKYMGSQGKNGASKGMAGVSRQIPANISIETREKIRDMAVKAFSALDCSGVSRIDFMIDENDGSIYLNEINTIPGSLSFYLWESLGISYKELLDRLIELALKKERDLRNLTFSFDTNVLSMSSFGSKGKL